jgi:hypothetical protein
MPFYLNISASGMKPTILLHEQIRLFSKIAELQFYEKLEAVNAPAAISKAYQHGILATKNTSN